MPAKKTKVQTKDSEKKNSAKDREQAEQIEMLLLQASETKLSKALSRKSRNAQGVNTIVEGLMIPQRVVLQIADEVAKVVTKRLRKSPSEKKTSTAKFDNPIFLDTSAIIDGRVFDLINIGIFTGTLIVLDSVLTELKNIADSKDDIKKERGRKGLKYLEDVKKQKLVKLTTLKDSDNPAAVDDKIVQYAKEHKGRVITCDFNLSKKARISGVISIDMYELANVLKTAAIPGEVFWIKVIQKGKSEGQGVGYLPDGTMIVVEKGVDYIGKTIQVLVSRIIQTDAGKIFFSKVLEAASN